MEPYAFDEADPGPPVRKPKAESRRARGSSWQDPAGAALLTFGGGEGSGSAADQALQSRRVCRTLPLVVLHCLAIIGNEVQVWMEWISDERFRYVLVQSGFFFGMSICFMAFWYEHQRLQTLGYLEFHEKAAGFARFVVLVCAFGAVAVGVGHTFWPADGWHDFSRRRFPERYCER